MIACRDMDAYTEYKARSAVILIERAFNIAWTPEDEQDEDLVALWERLTSGERADLLAWIAKQEAESGVDP